MSLLFRKKIIIPDKCQKPLAIPLTHPSYELLSVVGGAQNPEFTGVNEDFEHHPTANGYCAVDLGQVLR